MSKFEAVIFDMDGTLLNSEEFAFKVWGSALKEFGFEFTRETMISMVGTSVKESNRILQETFGPELSIEELRARKLDIEMSALETEVIDARTGVIDLLEFLKNNNVKMGLATSTERDRAIGRLKCGGIFSYFKYMAFGDEVKNQKPDPEIYLKVAEMLNVNISRVLIVEDSPSGVRGALASGATVYWYRDLVEISDELKSKVREIDGMAEVIEDFRE